MGQKIAVELDLDKCIMVVGGMNQPTHGRPIRNLSTRYTADPQDHDQLMSCVRWALDRNGCKIGRHDPEPAVYLRTIAQAWARKANRLNLPCAGSTIWDMAQDEGCEVQEYLDKHWDPVNRDLSPEYAVVYAIGCVFTQQLFVMNADGTRADDYVLTSGWGFLKTARGWTVVTPCTDEEEQLLDEKENCLCISPTIPYVNTDDEEISAEELPRYATGGTVARLCAHIMKILVDDQGAMPVTDDVYMEAERVVLVGDTDDYGIISSSYAIGDGKSDCAIARPCFYSSISAWGAFSLGGSCSAALLLCPSGHYLLPWLVHCVKMGSLMPIVCGGGSGGLWARSIRSLHKRHPDSTLKTCLKKVTIQSGKAAPHEIRFTRTISTLQIILAFAKAKRVGRDYLSLVMPYKSGRKEFRVDSPPVQIYHSGLRLQMKNDRYARNSRAVLKERQEGEALHNFLVDDIKVDQGMCCQAPLWPTQPKKLTKAPAPGKRCNPPIAIPTTPHPLTVRFVCDAFVPSTWTLEHALEVVRKAFYLPNCTLQRHDGILEVKVSPELCKRAKIHGVALEPSAVVHGAGRCRVQSDAVAANAQRLVLDDLKAMGFKWEERLLSHILHHDRKCTLACFQAKTRAQRMQALSAALSRMGLHEYSSQLKDRNSQAPADSLMEDQLMHTEAGEPAKGSSEKMEPDLLSSGNRLDPQTSRTPGMSKGLK
eukprot:326027-Amphidinium_carterae.3